MNDLSYISTPVTSINGEITVPGDKSISHRSIILGAIAKGTSHIKGFLDGEDCIATLNAFRAMGVVIEGPVQQELVIHGVGKYGLSRPQQTIDCGNSGTSMRLLAGLLAAQSFDSKLSGDSSLLKRPMRRIAKPLTQMGAEIRTTDDKPPLYIKGGKSLQGIDYVLPEASAQVKSSILLAALYAKGATSVSENGISRDHTERMLKTFSYPLYQSNNKITVTADGELQGTDISVPGDISSASFFIVAATIIPGSEVLIRNVGINPTRTGVLHILAEMGANIAILNQRQEGGELVADLRVKYAQLQGIKIPSAMVPIAIDEFPILFIAAACAQGQTVLSGAKELRLKESDRIGVMAEGLKKLGLTVQEYEDGIMIQGGSILGGVVESKGDHRIAMSFAIAGALAKGSVTILNCANVATSFPTFVKTANELHLSIKEENKNV